MGSSKQVSFECQGIEPVDFEPRVSAYSMQVFCWWTAGDSVAVCVPLQSGFCAVAATSGTAFSDIDLSQN